MIPRSKVSTWVGTAIAVAVAMGLLVLAVVLKRKDGDRG